MRLGLRALICDGTYTAASVERPIACVARFVRSFACSDCLAVARDRNMGRRARGAIFGRNVSGGTA